MIYLFLSFLAVTVLFLVLVGLLHLRQLSRLSLRIKYLEGTTDMIYQSQTRIDKLLIAYMENE